MANYYTAAVAAGLNIRNKAMIGIYNGTGSGLVVRVYRIFMLNNQTVAVTGAVTTFSLYRISTGSGGTFLPYVKHDSASSSLPSQIIISSSMSYTTSDLLRKYVYSSDEPIASDANGIDELQTIPSLNVLWDSTKAVDCEPIVCREGYGIALINTLAAPVGIADVFVEFTAETT